MAPSPTLFVLLVAANTPQSKKTKSIKNETDLPSSLRSSAAFSPRTSLHATRQIIPNQTICITCEMLFQQGFELEIDSDDLPVKHTALK
jgi:hypothetical protein